MASRKRSCEIPFVQSAKLTLRAKRRDVDSAPIENSACDPVAPVSLRSKATHERHKGLNYGIGLDHVGVVAISAPIKTREQSTAAIGCSELGCALILWVIYPV